MCSSGTSKIKSRNMTSTFRYYQQEANIAICDELLTNKKCLVKMFCGTGKSLLMRKCSIIDAAKLVVYVFPSLSLIDQFYADYLSDFPIDDILKISSELEATTDPAKIAQFLSKQTNKIVCVTYHSYGTLLDNLRDVKINVCMFDEAHHAVGQTYQKLIFENDLCEKQIFFTATPKNANGIVMYDREQLDESICGKLVYDYSYLKGVVEGYLNPFEIRVDMYTENTNKSVYASIARAILTTGNNRCLTFHADVNTGRDTSVNNFVNDAEFKRTFKEIQKSEFPREKKYKKIQMIGMSSASNSDKRKETLQMFDTTPDNEVIVISSCETIGEGIDTKNANMCVFVDPKTSYVKIIQNIGRIVRKAFGVDKPNSTILIPCWVDKTKYVECDGDREKCDAVIREDMSASGNFNGILNVLSALKQEDEELYDICLNYPSSFSPHEIRRNLLKQGFKTLDPVGDGSLFENIRFVLDAEIDYDEYADCETDEEIIMRIAEDNDVCVEIHTTSLDNPIEIYNSDCEGREIIRLYRNDDVDEDYYDDDDDIGPRYQPIVKISGEKKSKNKLSAPNRENRMRLNVHTNPDVRVLWNISSDFDITKNICSCVIDCEVITYDPMKIAVGIVERANARKQLGRNVVPRQIQKTKRITDDLIQESKDASKLSAWKAVVRKGKYGGNKCSDEVRDYLDENLLEWRAEVDFDEKAMEYAIQIVERANSREVMGHRLLPRTMNLTTDAPEKLIQENKDARKLSMWKMVIQKGKYRGNKCSDEVRDYLDKNLPGWTTELDKRAMEDAEQIVERANKRHLVGGKFVPRQIQKKDRTTKELEQEHTDGRKLGMWKGALNGIGHWKCSDEVRDYLDKNLPGWRTDLDAKAMEDATQIVKRAKARELIGERLLPREIHPTKSRTSPALIQEHKDATKLGGLKKGLKDKGSNKCRVEVCDYLDKELPGWRTEVDFDKKAMEDAEQIVERANERKQNNQNVIPRQIHKDRNTKELEQEYKDATKIGYWKKALKTKGTKKCSDEVRDYLDINLPGWRTELDNKAMENAESIVERAKARELISGRLLPRAMPVKISRTSPELEQEHKDATKLGMWKKALKGAGTYNCSDEVRDYLDKNLPGWRPLDILQPKPKRSVKKKLIIIEESPVADTSQPKPKKSMKKKTFIIEEDEAVPCADISPQEPAEHKHKRVEAELSILNKRYKTLTSQNLRKEFTENPDLWTKYHEISEENEKSFPEDGIPRNRIIHELNKIQTKRPKVVVDMGCGNAQISQHYKNDHRFQFINYDHISSNDFVTSCDISRTPLDDNSVEICILSLAMWGSNCEEYITEANRILESNGELYIIEPTKRHRWSKYDEDGNIVQGKEGDKLKLLLETNGFHVKKSDVEKFCLFICSKLV
jgi:ribosomal RNA-processing protein 8